MTAVTVMFYIYSLIPRILQYGFYAAGILAFIKYLRKK